MRSNEHLQKKKNSSVFFKRMLHFRFELFRTVTRVPVESYKFHDSLSRDNSLTRRKCELPSRISRLLKQRLKNF